MIVSFEPRVRSLFFYVHPIFLFATQGGGTLKTSERMKTRKNDVIFVISFCGHGDCSFFFFLLWPFLFLSVVWLLLFCRMHARRLNMPFILGWRVFDGGKKTVQLTCRITCRRRRQEAVIQGRTRPAIKGVRPIVPH